MNLDTAQVEHLKAIAAKHDLLAPELEQAFDIVRSFLRKKKRLIYGGTAIDFALRVKGTHLYSDARNEAYPDYDFYSPTHLEDAYTLAAELQAAGMPNVSAIRALHFQTMKVRVDFVPVADISFMPTDVYALLEDKWSLVYEKMHFVHPTFQRLDLHSALAYPFDNAPLESVFERLKKDVKRLNLLMEHYPLEVEGDIPIAPIGAPVSKKGDDALLMAFGGTAYRMLIELHRRECATLGASPLDISIPDGKGPAQIASLYAEFPPSVSSKFVETCRPFLDLIPLSLVGPTLQLYDISRRLPACIRGKEMLIPSAQLVLMWLLLQVLQGRGGANQYESLLRVIRHMEEVYRKVGRTEPNFLTQSPFMICLEVHGSATLNASQQRALDRKLGKPDVNFNWYPSSGKPPPSVKLDMPEFQRDGECEKL